jgi:hypothetical protein
MPSYRNAKYRVVKKHTEYILFWVNNDDVYVVDGLMI